MESLFILKTIGVFLCVYVFIRITAIIIAWRYQVKWITKLPGFKPHPLLGILAEFPDAGEAGLAFVRNNLHTYPRVSHVFAGPIRIIVSVLHPEPAKAILKTSEPKAVAGGLYNFILPWLGDGLLISRGQKWARNRRLLTPAFHFDILKPYLTINNRSADVLLKKIQENSSKDKYIEVFSYISLCTLEIILKCAFSFEEDVQTKGDSHPYVNAVQKMATIVVNRTMEPWMYPDIIFFLTPKGREFRKHCDFVHSVSTDVIRRRKQTLQKGDDQKKKMLDFLDILLTAKDEHGKGLTDREIRDEVDTFLFEGHDTTASGISWTLYSLAENPEWQEKCREEIDEILEGRDSDDILWEDLSRLKVLAACIKEGMRLHAPVPFIERKTTKEMYMDGYWLPSGSLVSIFIYAIMHNPYVWDEPMKFKPERFMTETAMNAYSFVPFSAGPRNCIGQSFAMHEMKVIIARVIQRFRLEVDPLRPAKHQITVVMKTSDGMYVKASPRTGHP